MPATAPAAQPFSSRPSTAAAGGGARPAGSSGGRDAFSSRLAAGGRSGTRPALHGEESGREATASGPPSSVDDASSFDLDGLSATGGVTVAAAVAAASSSRREDSESLEFDDGGEGRRRVGVWPAAAPPPPSFDRGSDVDGGAGLDGSTISGGDTGAIRAELQRLRAGFEARLTGGGPGVQAQRQGQMHEKVQL